MADTPVQQKDDAAAARRRADELRLPFDPLDLPPDPALWSNVPLDV
jgi:hypothetical protein